MPCKWAGLEERCIRLRELLAVGNEKEREQAQAQDQAPGSVSWFRGSEDGSNVQLHRERAKTVRYGMV